MPPIVRIHNAGDTTFTDMFNGQPFSIPPGGDEFIDFDAMCLWLGHPEANNNDPRNRVRVAEYQRLRTRYGVSAQELQLNMNGQQVDTNELFDQMRPKLEVYDTQGKPIITVADDPDGTLLTAKPETAPSQELILSRMQQMEQEMAALRSELAQRERTAASLNDAQPIDADRPTAPPPNTTLNIPGAITVTQPDEPVDPTSAPRPQPRTAPGEDAPTRVRVSSE